MKKKGRGLRRPHLLRREREVPRALGSRASRARGSLSSHRKERSRILRSRAERQSMAARAWV